MFYAGTDGAVTFDNPPRFKVRTVVSVEAESSRP